MPRRPDRRVFLKDKLGIKASELHRGLGDAFQELNKRTHVRPDTELTSEAEIDEFADAALIALDDLFVAMDEMRETANIEPLPPLGNNGLGEHSWNRG